MRGECDPLVLVLKGCIASGPVDLSSVHFYSPASQIAWQLRCISDKSGQKHWPGKFTTHLRTVLMRKTTANLKKYAGLKQQFVEPERSSNSYNITVPLLTNYFVNFYRRIIHRSNSYPLAPKPKSIQPTHFKTNLLSSTHIEPPPP